MNFKKEKKIYSAKVPQGNRDKRSPRRSSKRNKALEEKRVIKSLFEFNLIYCDLMVNRVMNEINQL
ncbi:MAG: hypothetical protein JST67_10635 [Bacteroidetes bacterium]|nr:hypothetical protein [Bacteroidota bacterium]